MEKKLKKFQFFFQFIFCLIEILSVLKFVNDVFDFKIIYFRILFLNYQRKSDKN